MIPLPKIPYIHRIYMVLANPRNVFFPTTGSFLELVDRKSWVGAMEDELTHIHTHTYTHISRCFIHRVVMVLLGLQGQQDLGEGGGTFGGQLGVCGVHGSQGQAGQHRAQG
jgi:hypothetical protein